MEYLSEDDMWEEGPSHEDNSSSCITLLVTGDASVGTDRNLFSLCRNYVLERFHCEYLHLVVDRETQMLREELEASVGGEGSCWAALQQGREVCSLLDSSRPLLGVLRILDDIDDAGSFLRDMRLVHKKDRLVVDHFFGQVSYDSTDLVLSNKRVRERSMETCLRQHSSSLLPSQTPPPNDRDKQTSSSRCHETRLSCQKILKIFQDCTPYFITW